MLLMGINNLIAAQKISETIRMIETTATTPKFTDSAKCYDTFMSILPSLKSNKELITNYRKLINDYRELFQGMA